MNQKKGFTLVEIAIVMVVIGVVVGAILIGNSLISSSKIQSFTKQNGQLDSAVRNFETRYRTVPGDSELIEPKGDGDNIIEDNSGVQGVGASWSTGNGEVANFWHHLSEAGVKSKSGTNYTNLMVGGKLETDLTNKLSSNMPGVEMAAPGTGIIATNDNGSLASNGLSGVYVIGVVTGITDADGGSISFDKLGAAFNGQQLAAIDSKQDDGSANTGDIRAFVGGTATGATTYDVASSQPAYTAAIKYLKLANSKNPQEAGGSTSSSGGGGSSSSSSSSSSGGEEFCGDMSCNDGEACYNSTTGQGCNDCGTCVCGDGNCDSDSGEDSGNCVQDCGGDYCGNGSCDGGESCYNSTTGQGCNDCGDCYCGDMSCDSASGEDSGNCPDDCGGTTYCGDMNCDDGEYCYNTSTGEGCSDCGECSCGDMNCDDGSGENSSTCPQDCGGDYCGDMSCNGGESCYNTSTGEGCSDCGECYCGDMNCDDGSGENSSTCPQDCGDSCADPGWCTDYGYAEYWDGCNGCYSAATGEYYNSYENFCGYLQNYIDGSYSWDGSTCQYGGCNNGGDPGWCSSHGYGWDCEFGCYLDSDGTYHSDYESLCNAMQNYVDGNYYWDGTYCQYDSSCNNGGDPGWCSNNGYSWDCDFGCYLDTSGSYYGDYQSFCEALQNWIDGNYYWDGTYCQYGGGEYCGDGSCSGSEDCDNCYDDCRCDNYGGGYVCANNGNGPNGFECVYDECNTDPGWCYDNGYGEYWSGCGGCYSPMVGNSWTDYQDYCQSYLAVYINSNYYWNGYECALSDDCVAPGWCYNIAYGEYWDGCDNGCYSPMSGGYYNSEESFCSYRSTYIDASYYWDGTYCQYGGSSGGYCGDGNCDGEDIWSCEQDCHSCGDGYCSGGYEDCWSCSMDCSCGEYCGDGSCNNGETCYHSSTTQGCNDCGTCYCGDGTCNGESGEDSGNCSQDCGGGGWCGDGYCDPYIGENCSGCSDCNCSMDYSCNYTGNYPEYYQCEYNSSSTGGWCGDGNCDPYIGENCSGCSDCNCSWDQSCNYTGSSPYYYECQYNGSSTGGGYCGDGSCNDGESVWTCEQDCHNCGDGTCSNSYEDCNSCSSDCGTCSCSNYDPGWCSFFSGNWDNCNAQCNGYGDYDSYCYANFGMNCSDYCSGSYFGGGYSWTGTICTP